jgi:predicted PhzF superfamily epimerase YddE/YHI9
MTGNSAMPQDPQASKQDAIDNPTIQARVSCFANPRRGLAGNACNVHVGDQAPAAATHADEYHCYVGPPESGCYPVRCFLGRQLIQCCGHGLLAAAATIFRMTGHTNVRLEMSGTIMDAEQQPDSDMVWLAFPTPDMQRGFNAQLQSCVSTIAGLLDVETGRISDAALSGEEEGYLVMRLQDGLDLAAFSPPGMALANITRRALIVTTLLDRVGGIGLRYFAPQYGVEEDAATGSAMRVLAGYWADRFERLTATQCSPAGGELFSTIAGNTTRIGGRVVTAE